MGRRKNAKINLSSRNKTNIARRWANISGENVARSEEKSEVMCCVDNNACLLYTSRCV